MNDLWTEVGYLSLNKQGEQLCGDRVETSGGGEGDTTVVLADGLGSGVKANILSTLTSKILCTMITGGVDVEECVKTIAGTLPVCKVRGVAYSTFSIAQILSNERCRLIEFDNPSAIVLRDGKPYEYAVSKRTLSDKEIAESTFSVTEGDLIVLMSDGAIYAGVGMTMNMGWQRENIVEFLTTHYRKDQSAKAVATMVAEECNRLYGEKPGDDTTIAVIRIRKRHTVNLVVGPPSSKDQDMKMMNLFFATQGTKIVCGGTTSNIASAYLNKPLKPTLDYPDPEIPPISELEGVDLVTEGVVTLSKVLTYAEDYLKNGSLVADWETRSDGASQIAQELFENATDIRFFVGKAINPAHQNPNLPITFSIKLQLIQSLGACLEKMGKHIRLAYF